MNLTLLILAAGIGSRYGGLKQLDQIGPSGETIIDYSIYDAMKAGFQKIVFIIRHDIESAFREKVGKSIEKRIDTQYVFQDMNKLPKGFSVPEKREKPWGTGHAILCCKEAVKENFGVINADDFYGPSAFNVLADYLKNAKPKEGVEDFCLIGYILKNTLSDHGHVARGICSATPDGVLTDIVERVKIQRIDGDVKFTEDGENWVSLSEDTLVSMNMFGFTPGLLQELEKRFPLFLRKRMSDLKAEFFIPSVVDELIKEKKAVVQLLSTLEKWYGITYKEDKPIVQQAIRDMVDKGVYPQKLWSE